jgi:hypothetical protein
MDVHKSGVGEIDFGFGEPGSKSFYAFRDFSFELHAARSFPEELSSALTTRGG